MTEMKALYGIREYRVNRQTKNQWTRIGTAFLNKDGSWNLVYDFLPADPSTTIQMRDPFPREAEKPSDDADLSQEASANY